MELDDLSLHPSDYVVYWSTFEKKIAPWEGESTNTMR